LNGCEYATNSDNCDDGDVCTTQDKCENKKCLGGPNIVCDDGNICTDDSCDPQDGCIFAGNDAECDDNNKCTVDDQCSGGWCGSGALLDCDDSNLCTDDGCNPESGCVYFHNTNPCDDENLCTVGDECSLGACVPGPAMPCDDGNFCNGTETCQPDVGCMAGDAPVVDDEVECTTDYCDADLPGVVHKPDDSLCPAAGLCETSTCDAEEGCKLETVIDCCGNLHTEEGEECDDGNLVNTDGCVACLDAFCGDGFIQEGEEDCDGDDVGGATCTGLLGADYSGDVGCTGGCKHDTTQCVGPLGTELNPADNCQEILDAGDSTGDGVYHLNHGEDAVKAYCDMTGGGWTMVASWPHEKTTGAWGEFTTGLDDPGPGKKHAQPFRAMFPHPSQVKLTYLGNDQSLTFDLSQGSDWQVDDPGARFPTSDGKYVIFERHHCDPGQGICVCNGSYSDGFNCDGDSGQVAGQGIFNHCTKNEFCNCGSYGWKYEAGGCNATVCTPDKHLAVYLR